MWVWVWVHDTRRLLKAAEAREGSAEPPATDPCGGAGPRQASRAPAREHGNRLPLPGRRRRGRAARLGTEVRGPVCECWPRRARVVAGEGLHQARFDSDSESD